MKTGELTIFTSYTPGAGKSYLMLEKAMQEKDRGADVEIVFLNGRHRQIDELLEKNQMPKANTKKYSVQEIIARHPQLVAVDEMGMNGLNSDESTYVYEDIDKMLSAGIDVYATANLKRFTSLNLKYKAISGIGIRKTIPDVFLERAKKIYFIDRSPGKMIDDFEAGNLFSERYMKSNIMRKNFRKQILESYRKLSMECMKPYMDKTEIIERR